MEPVRCAGRISTDSQLVTAQGDKFTKAFRLAISLLPLSRQGRKLAPMLGRVLCRASGSFDITTASVRVAGISHKYCQPIHRKDGYTYA